MAAAVLLPASFVAFCAEGFFLAVADGLNPAGADAGSGERIFYSAGTLVSESQVVVGGSALVAVSFNREVEVGVLIEELHVRLHRSLLIGADAASFVGSPSGTARATRPGTLTLAANSGVANGRWALVQVTAPNTLNSPQYLAVAVNRAPASSRRLFEAVPAGLVLTPASGQQVVRKAYERAAAAHIGQRRLSGEDYVNHPL